MCNFERRGIFVSVFLTELFAPGGQLADDPSSETPFWTVGIHIGGGAVGTVVERNSVTSAPINHAIASRSREDKRGEERRRRRRTRTAGEEESRANRGGYGHVPTIYRFANEPGTGRVQSQMRWLYPAPPRAGWFVDGERSTTRHRAHSRGDVRPSLHLQLFIARRFASESDPVPMSADSVRLAAS